MGEAASLLAEFRSLLRSASPKLRVIFGKLLCLRDQRSREKRQDDPGLDDFFDKLSDKDLGDILGFAELNSGARPTASLAFAVDTTGSMHEEIDDVRELIKAFVASEKSEPFLYVLARFNDRGDSGVCDIELGKKLIVRVYGIYGVHPVIIEKWQRIKSVSLNEY